MRRQDTRVEIQEWEEIIYIDGETHSPMVEEIILIIFLEISIAWTGFLKDIQVQEISYYLIIMHHHYQETVYIDMQFDNYMDNLLYH